MEYYCARLLIVCLVNDGRKQRKNICDYPFVIFRARDHRNAFKRAIMLGKEQEHSYKNTKGKSVRWAFVRVEEIRRIGRQLDGREVGSVMDVLKTDAPIPFRKKFNPEKRKPMMD